MLVKPGQETKQACNFQRFFLSRTRMTHFSSMTLTRKKFSFGTKSLKTLLSRNLHTTSESS